MTLLAKPRFGLRGLTIDARIWRVHSDDEISVKLHRIVGSEHYCEKSCGLQYSD